MKLSDLFHMDVYSDAGQYLGDVQSIVVDLESGEVSRILMIPWKGLHGDIKNTLKQKSILYKNVKNVGDVVLVTSQGSPGTATREEEADLAR